MYLLLLLLLVPAFTNSEPDADPSVGIDLPHGSITFFGSNFGDSLPQISRSGIETSTPSYPTYVTSFAPSFAPYTPIQSNPITFFKKQPPTPAFNPTSQENNPSFYSLSYSTDQQSNPNIEVRNPSFSPFTQGPINSAVPFSLFYPEFPTTKPDTFGVRDQTETPTYSKLAPALQPIFFEPKFEEPKFSFSSMGKTLEDKKSSDQPKGAFLQQVKEVTVQVPTRLEDIELQEKSQPVSQFGSKKKNLEQFWHSYNSKGEVDKSGDRTSLETINTDSFSKKSTSLNDIPIPSDSRKTRKIDFSSPSAKNITGLIKKALSLVKKVEEIDDRKRTLKSSIGSSKSSSKSSKRKEKERSRDDNDDAERIRDLKEERRFDDLKSFIQDQSSISNLIKSETSGLRDLLESRDIPRETSNTKPTRDMIKALARLNSISSLLLKDNVKTKNTVRQLPDEIRNIVQSEIVELKDLLEDQNIAVASALKSAIRSENRSERKVGNSQTEVVILKALAKLNKISGVLLKEQEKTEQQTSSALKALPALAKFIQAETSDIKDLIEEQADSTKNEDFDELKDAISQSLANDKLITRAIIKLNDITQLLLKDVNFTTSAITNKLPEALTALITSETGKIRKMIDLQNDAIVDILKESDNLARAERVIQEAQKIKQTLAGRDPDTSEERRFISESDRILEVIAPLISKNGKSSFNGDGSRADKLIDILTPILNKQTQTKEAEEKQNETEAVLKAQLTGQKSIVQALLKLTNITRTLLEDKDKEKSRREKPRTSGKPRFDSREEEESRDSARERENERGDRRPSRNNRKKQRFDDDLSEEYDDEYSEYYDDVPSRRSETLVERIATSAGNRALKGNQALFEEFVKLAIERQRWEQAQDVTNIIKSTLTTEPPPDYSEEYYYSDEEIEERPRSQRPNKPKRKRPTERTKRPLRKRPTKFRDDFEDEVYDYEEEEVPIRGRVRPTTKKPLRRTTRKPRPTRPPRTTTALPIEYDDYDFEEYPLYEEDFLEDDYPVEKEVVEEKKEPIQSKRKFPTERLQPQRGNNIRQKFNEDKKSPTIKELINSRSKPEVDRPRFQIPTRGRFNRPGRRNEQKTLEREEAKQPAVRIEKKDPVTKRPNVLKGKPTVTEDKDSGSAKETRRPSFGNSNESGSRLTASNLNAKDNVPSIIEITTPRVIKVETQPPIVRSKPTEGITEETTRRSFSVSEREQKRNDLKENLLQSLLNHSKKKEDSVKVSVSSNPRKESPRKLENKNAVSEKEEQRSSGVRGSTRGRNFGRGGIPSRRRPDNALETNQKLVVNTKPQKSPEPISPVSKQKPKSFKDSIVDNLKSLVDSQAINNKSDEQKQQKKVISAIKDKDFQKNLPLLPTISPPQIRTTKRPQSTTSQRKESPKPDAQRPKSQRDQKQRPEFQRAQGKRPQSQRGLSQRPDSRRPGRPTTNRPTTQRPIPQTPDTERPRSARPQSNRPGSKRPQSSRPGSKRPQANRPGSRRPQQTTLEEEEQIAKQVIPLNEEERKSQKNQRNSLLKQLSKNRSDPRQTGSRNSRPPKPAQRPTTVRPKKQEKKTEMSALENLFSIISASKENNKDSSQTVVKVTSTSSSSSSSSSRESSVPNVRIRPHGKKQGKRKKSARPHNATPTPTEDPSLQSLTPQERLVKKVQETLRSGDDSEADIVRPKSNRKKVIFRKKKTNISEQLARSGRQLGSDGTQIKTVKVRVRRIVEPLPFPIVY